MINGEAPDEFWIKNFRMTKESFAEQRLNLNHTFHPILAHQTIGHSLVQRNWQSRCTI